METIEEIIGTTIAFGPIEMAQELNLPLPEPVSVGKVPWTRILLITGSVIVIGGLVYYAYKPNTPKHISHIQEKGPIS